VSSFVNTLGRLGWGNSRREIYISGDFSRLDPFSQQSWRVQHRPGAKPRSLPRSQLTIAPSHPTRRIPRTSPMVLKTTMSSSCLSLTTSSCLALPSYQQLCAFSKYTNQQALSLMKYSKLCDSLTLLSIYHPLSRALSSCSIVLLYRLALSSCRLSTIPSSNGIGRWLTANLCF
jgi:hypothetical protein